MRICVDLGGTKIEAIVMDEHSRLGSILVSLDSFISITMLLMIDPIMQLQTHPSLETRPLVQTQAILEKTSP